MANPNSPFGFRPIIRMGGAPFSLNEYGKPATDPNAIFAFDLLVKVAAATPLPEAPLAYNLPACQTGYQGTPGTSLWLGASMAYGAPSVASVHPVTDEPDVLYITQASGVTSITTAAHVGKNTNVLLTTAGNTSTKMSGMQANSGAIATGRQRQYAHAGLQVRADQVERAPVKGNLGGLRQRPTEGARQPDRRLQLLQCPHDHRDRLGDFCRPNPDRRGLSEGEHHDDQPDAGCRP